MTIADNDVQDGVISEQRREVKEPPMFKVLLHNDDYTSMDFVILVLESVFHKRAEDATRIMLNVHQQGVGVAGVYTRDMAETKIALVHDLARHQEYPLKCSLEQM
ncbi:MAG: ATP-dependent Clp protease adapter ClpS [Desulfurivibrionaceae bacterium]|nr:ATP-dependent Clp protease adapter ClpS [Desulfurivibrionaceae bacterium]